MPADSGLRGQRELFSLPGKNKEVYFSYFALYASACG